MPDDSCPCAGLCTCCSRKRLDATGQQRQETEILEINVRPGWKAGTKITFQEKGEACIVPHGIGRSDEQAPGQALGVTSSHWGQARSALPHAARPAAATDPPGCASRCCWSRHAESSADRRCARPRASSSVCTSLGQQRRPYWLPCAAPGPQATRTRGASPRTSSSCCRRGRTRCSSATATTLCTRTGARAGGGGTPAGTRTNGKGGGGGGSGCPTAPSLQGCPSNGPPAYLQHPPTHPPPNPNAPRRTGCRWRTRCAAQSSSCRHWTAGRCRSPSTKCCPRRCAAALRCAVLHGHVDSGTAAAPASTRASQPRKYDATPAAVTGSQPWWRMQLLTRGISCSEPHLTLALACPFFPSACRLRRWCRARACPSPSTRGRRATCAFGEPSGHGV